MTAKKPTSVTMMAVLSAALAMIPVGAVACVTPVFRYALERWPADIYHIEINHDGALTPRQTEQLELLRQLAIADPAAEHAGDGDTNFRLRVNAHDRSTDASAPEAENAAGAEIKVFFPSRKRGSAAAFHRAPFTPETLEQLLDSPVRRELAKRLIDGDSMVWLFLDGPDKQLNESRYNLLRDQLTILEKQLKLPLDQLPNSNAPASSMEGGPSTADLQDLEIRFSIIRLTRDDPAEQFFCRMLLATKRVLMERNDTMVFPVFGRGRLLYALVGKGINPNTIQRAARYVTDSCSCEVKAQNPGVDLLITADWEQALDNDGEFTAQPPALVGLSDLVAAGREQADDTIPAVEPPHGTASLSPSSDTTQTHSAPAETHAGSDPHNTNEMTTNPMVTASVAILALIIVLGVIGTLALRKKPAA